MSLHFCGLANMWFLIPFLVTVLVITSLLLVLVILMQRPKSQGLGAAFGGDTADSLFGAQTTSVLGKLTVWLGIAFFVITLLIAILYARTTTGPSDIQKQLTEAAAPIEETAAAADDSTSETSPEAAAVTTPEEATAEQPAEAAPAASPELAESRATESTPTEEAGAAPEPVAVEESSPTPEESAATPSPTASSE